MPSATAAAPEPTAHRQVGNQDALTPLADTVTGDLLSGSPARATGPRFLRASQPSRTTVRGPSILERYLPVNNLDVFSLNIFLHVFAFSIFLDVCFLDVWLLNV